MITPQMGYLGQPLQLFVALAAGRASGFQLADEAAEVLKEVEDGHAVPKRGKGEP